MKLSEARRILVEVAAQFVVVLHRTDRPDLDRWPARISGSERAATKHAARMAHIYRKAPGTVVRVVGPVFDVRVRGKQRQRDITPEEAELVVWEKIT
jgi:hypothetical protein